MRGRLLAALSVGAAVLAAGQGAHAARDPRMVLGELRRAEASRGIDEARFVKIGGIDQWISVRGRHRDAPILLFLHGGPSFTSIPDSWLYQQGWDEYFTVAQWDQRGAGKTYGANPPEAIKPTLTVDRMFADAEEVAAYLRRTYGRRKIVLIGFSWGSYLGVRLAERHPDWFYAYVGAGQVTNFPKSEALGYATTLAAAKKAGDAEAVKELQALAPFPDPKHPERDAQNIDRERHWLSKYGGSAWSASEGQLDRVGALSPDYSDKDLADREKGLELGLDVLWAPLASADVSHIRELKLPVVLIEGRHDLEVNAGLSAAWFARLKAPKKTLVWFEDSAHMAIEEEPGKTLIVLKEDVLPLTKAGR